MMTRSSMIVMFLILAGLSAFPFITSMPEQSSEVQPNALPEFYSRDVVQYFPVGVEEQLTNQREILEAYKKERARKSAQPELR